MKMENEYQTPCYILDEAKFLKNLNIFKDLSEKTGVSFLLSLKGFAMWKAFPIMKDYCSGCSASSLFEAKLAKEEFSKELHSYSPAFLEKDFEEMERISDHLIFNSLTQW